METSHRVTHGAVALAAAFVLILGLSGAGLGYANGDAAVYAAQGAAGDLADRFVHVGWITLAVALAPLAGGALPAWLDRVNVLFAMVAVLAVARLSPRPAAAALGFAAVIAPVASFAEVDVPWVTLVLLAATAPGRTAALPLAAAISLSPTALLALPWLLVLRPERRRLLLAAAAVTVALLSVPHHGAWWLGERGVLRSPPPRLLASARAWAIHLPWLLVLPAAMSRRWRSLLTTVPLLLAPPDAAAWLLPGAALALAAAELPVAWLPVALIGQLGLGAWAWQGRCGQVREETATLGRVVAWLEPGDSLVGPWGWGVRASVLATGHPYGLAWRVPDDPVRDQASWCDRHFSRVLALPPGTRSAGVSDWRPGPAGTWWAPGADPGWQQLPGCGE